MIFKVYSKHVFQMGETGEMSMSSAVSSAKSSQMLFLKELMMVEREGVTEVVGDGWGVTEVVGDI